jgi:hypothetical protein
MLAQKKEVLKEESKLFILNYYFNISNNDF